MPANVIDRGDAACIKSKSQVLSSEAEVADIVSAIKSGTLPKGWKTRRGYVRQVDRRFSSTTV